MTSLLCDDSRWIFGADVLAVDSAALLVRRVYAAVGNARWIDSRRIQIHLSSRFRSKLEMKWRMAAFFLFYSFALFAAVVDSGGVLVDGGAFCWQLIVLAFRLDCS